MKLFKKASHCLLVEEERYKWAEPKSRGNRSLLIIAVCFVIASVLFGVLN